MSALFRASAHGSFAFDYRGDVTLVSVSGSWNDLCAKAYRDVLRAPIGDRTFGPRGVIIDGRTWELITPEVGAIFRETNEMLARHYERLHIGYVVNRDLRRLAEHLLHDASRPFEEAVV